MTPLTSKMKGNYLENARTAHEGSLPLGKRRLGAENKTRLQASQLWPKPKAHILTLLLSYSASHLSLPLFGRQESQSEKEQKLVSLCTLDNICSLLSFPFTTSFSVCYFFLSLSLSLAVKPHVHFTLSEYAPVFNACHSSTNAFALAQVAPQNKLSFDTRYEEAKTQMIRL